MLRLPLTVRIPLAVSLLFLVISAALISLALHGVSRQFDRQVRDLGQVYLDGLSAAILPAVRARDEAQMIDVLNRALDTHLGVIDRTLAVVTPDHRMVAHVARYPEVEPIPLALLTAPSGTLVSLRSAGCGPGARWMTNGPRWACWWPISMSATFCGSARRWPGSWAWWDWRSA